MGCSGPEGELASARPADSLTVAARVTGGMSALTRSADDAPIGTTRELIRELGCGACHAGVPDAAEAIRDRAPPLGSAGRPLEFGFLVDFLRDPRRLRQDIGRSRMPDFHLDERESLALALFLTRERPEPGEPGRAPARAPDVPSGIDAELGREIFVALNCAGCHRHPEAEPRRNAPDLADLQARVRPAWLRRWLASPSAVRPFGHRPGTGGRMPDFRLDPPEVDSLADHLLSGSASAEADGGSSGADGRDAFEPRELSAFERRKAEALLRDRLSCLGCHRLGGDGGRIGPDLTGAGDRLRPGYLHAVIRDPELAAPGTVMPEVPMTSERRRLIASFLAGGSDPEAGGGDGRAAGDDDDATAGEGGSVGAERGADDPRDRAGYLSLVDHPLRPPPAAPVESESPAGGELYAARCAACHGAEGEGDGYNARYLPVPPTVHASASYISTRPDATVFDGIHAGGRILDRSHRMPPFGESLDPERIRSLVDHIRALCDCEGPAWSR